MTNDTIPRSSQGITTHTNRIIRNTDKKGSSGRTWVVAETGRLTYGLKDISRAHLGMDSYEGEAHRVE